MKTDMVSLSITKKHFHITQRQQKKVISPANSCSDRSMNADLAQHRITQKHSNGTQKVLSAETMLPPQECSRLLRFMNAGLAQRKIPQKLLILLRKLPLQSSLLTV